MFTFLHNARWWSRRSSAGPRVLINKWGVVLAFKRGEPLALLLQGLDNAVNFPQALAFLGGFALQLRLDQGFNLFAAHFISLSHLLYLGFLDTFDLFVQAAKLDVIHKPLESVAVFEQVSQWKPARVPRVTVIKYVVLISVAEVRVPTQVHDLLLHVNEVSKGLLVGA